jgi:hypothetical protein
MEEVANRKIGINTYLVLYKNEEDGHYWWCLAWDVHETDNFGPFASIEEAVMDASGWLLDPIWRDEGWLIEPTLISHLTV